MRMESMDTVPQSNKGYRKNSRFKSKRLPVLYGFCVPYQTSELKRLDKGDVPELYDPFAL